MTKLKPRLSPSAGKSQSTDMEDALNRAIEMIYFGKVESLDFFGNGILHKVGKCCFIKNALPFEEIMYELTENKKNYARGETAEVLSPSLQRIKPPCPYYGDCGGCSFQHVDYAGEAAAKERHVERVLQKIGGCGDTLLLPFDRAQRIYGYRNQVTFHMKEGQTCFYRQATHDYVTIDRCELLEDVLNQAVAEINAAGLNEAVSVSLRGDNTGHVFAAVTGGSAEKIKKLLTLSEVITGAAAVSEKGETIFGDGTLLFDIDGIKLKTSYKSFFQVNTEMAKTMLRYCKDLFEGDRRGVLLDLYCGVGSIGLYLAESFQKVYGIEIVKDAAALANENAGRNGVKAAYISGKTENRLKDLLQGIPQADTVILDPPRQGLQKDVAKTIAAYGAKNILYISCDPASLSRDLQELTKLYRVVSAKPFDLFPRTAHVETVVLLSHKNADTHINVNVEFGEGDGKIPVGKIAEKAEDYRSGEKVTYKMIQEYIESKYGFKVHTAYIAEVKRELGLPMYVAPNAVEELKNSRKHPTPEKVEAIMDALKHYKIVLI